MGGGKKKFPGTFFSWELFFLILGGFSPCELCENPNSRGRMSAGQTGHMTGQTGHVHGTDGTHTRGCPAKILYVSWFFFFPQRRVQKAFLRACGTTAPKQSVAQCETLFQAISPSAKQGLHGAGDSFGTLGPQTQSHSPKSTSGHLGLQVLATGKYVCRKVRAYPAECSQQLGRDPSKNGSSKFLDLKSASGKNTIWDSALPISLTLSDTPVLCRPPLPPKNTRKHLF